MRNKEDETLEEVIESIKKLSAKAQRQVVTNVFPLFFSRMKTFADNGEISHEEAMDELDSLLKTWELDR